MSGDVMSDPREGTQTDPMNALLWVRADTLADVLDWDDDARADAALRVALARRGAALCWLDRVGLHTQRLAYWAEEYLYVAIGALLLMDDEETPFDEVAHARLGWKSLRLARRGPAREACALLRLALDHAGGRSSPQWCEDVLVATVGALDAGDLFGAVGLAQDELSFEDGAAPWP